VSPYARTVKIASGCDGVQIVYSSHRLSRDMEHIGSAHDDVQPELLKVRRVPASGSWPEGA